jgi:ABC-type transport system involved in multi-copper enzyme maturation permease subunit
VGPLPDRWNPVLRGDLRVRTGSRKLWAMQGVYLGILAVLVFLGLPPELGRIAESHEPSLYVAVLWVQVVLVTYLASAFAVQEIAVEGEKAPVDLLYAPFTPGTIVAGKSLAALATIAFWLLLGLPLLVLAMVIRQVPTSTLVPVTGLVAAMAWGIAQMGLLLGIVCEAEFSRTLAHWAMLAVVFVGTGSLPPLVRALNPIVATTAAATGAFPAQTLAAYGLLGLACAAGAYVRLSNMVAAS